MKKNLLLSLALLTSLTSLASAAQKQPQSEPLALPTYVVETERYAAAEQYINSSLEAFRAQADIPVKVAVELPALRNRVAHVAKKVPSTRLAKS